MHIDEIKSRDFTPSFDRVAHEKIIKENPEKNYTISLPFTSGRCEEVQSNLKKILKPFAPEYALKFCMDHSTHFKVLQSAAKS